MPDKEGVSGGGAAAVQDVLPGLVLRVVLRIWQRGRGGHNRTISKLSCPKTLFTTLAIQ
jgi:hypothetical protein